MAPLRRSPAVSDASTAKLPGGRRWPNTHELHARLPAAACTPDLGPPEVEFNFPLVFVCVHCTFGRRRELVPRRRLYFAHSEETTAGEGAEACLRGLVIHDQPQCKAPPEARLPAVQ